MLENKPLINFRYINYKHRFYDENKDMFFTDVVPIPTKEIISELKSEIKNIREEIEVLNKKIEEK